MNDVLTEAQSVSGKNVLVTGGTTGIGRAIVHALCQQGATVVTFGRDADDVEALIDDVASLPGRVHGFTADVSNVEDIRRIFAEVDEELDSLDILVNNAAIYGDEFDEQSLENIDYVVRTNISGYIGCAHEGVARMKKAGRGHIVLIGSMSADLREEDGSTYVATKGAIQAFSESLRKTVNEQGIKVTLVEPGKVATDMVDKSEAEMEKQIGQSKMLRPEDIAAAVMFALMQPERCDIVSLQIRPHLQVI